MDLICVSECSDKETLFVLLDDMPEVVLQNVPSEEEPDLTL